MEVVKLSLQGRRLDSCKAMLSQLCHNCPSRQRQKRENLTTVSVGRPQMVRPELGNSLFTRLVQIILFILFAHIWLLPLQTAHLWSCFILHAVFEFSVLCLWAAYYLLGQLRTGSYLRHCRKKSRRTIINLAVCASNAWRVYPVWLQTVSYTLVLTLTLRWTPTY